MKRSILLAIGITVASLFLWSIDDSASLGSSGPAAEVRKAGQEVAAAGKKITGIVREVTAYNVGVRAQTSDTPCIGAGGHDLCRLLERDVKVCAANFVALGTILDDREVRRVRRPGPDAPAVRTPRRHRHEGA